MRLPNTSTDNEPSGNQEANRDCYRSLCSPPRYRSVLNASHQLVGVHVDCGIRRRRLALQSLRNTKQFCAGRALVAMLLPFQVLRVAAVGRQMFNELFAVHVLDR